MVGITDSDNFPTTAGAFDTTFNGGNDAFVARIADIVPTQPGGPPPDGHPETTGKVTGGGYIILSKSAGERKGDVGSRNNFGFNVKYNKGGTNPQGHANVIWRSGGHTYQVKSTSITSMSADPTTGNAQFVSKGVIQDITNQDAPVSVDGNATLKLEMVDKGEPGSSDTIAITVYKKDNTLYYSSNWNGTNTVQQTLDGGNLSVH